MGPLVAGECHMDASDHRHFPRNGPQPEAAGICTDPRGAAGGVEQQLVCQVLQARQLLAGELGCPLPGAHLPQPLRPLVSARSRSLLHRLYVQVGCAECWAWLLHETGHLCSLDAPSPC